jgi:hypothetical protein
VSGASCIAANTKLFPFEQLSAGNDFAIEQGMAECDNKAAVEERERAAHLVERADELTQIADELKREAERIVRCADELTAPL